MKPSVVLVLVLVFKVTVTDVIDNFSFTRQHFLLTRKKFFEKEQITFSCEFHRFKVDWKISAS